MNCFTICQSILKIFVVQVDYILTMNKAMKWTNIQLLRCHPIIPETSLYFLCITRIEAVSWTFVLCSEQHKRNGLIFLFYFTQHKNTADVVFLYMDFFCAFKQRQNVTEKKKLWFLKKYQFNNRSQYQVLI